MENVLLDTMDGFEFEDFFGHLLTRLGRGVVEKTLYTHDEGRDILFRTPTGLIVVECKHQPNGNIGRPVVQKLHSAVISSGAKSGILVTTGQFTKEALVHARKLSPAIEMIDMSLLTEMAARAGITMVTKGQTLNVWTLSLPNEAVTQTELSQYLNGVLEAHPRPVGLLLHDVSRRILYRPIYLVTYDVHSVFSTSLGVIHTEYARQAKLAIDGVSGGLVDMRIRDFIVQENPSPFLGIPREVAVEPPRFRLDAVTALTRAKENITRLHTRSVTYSGRRNRRHYQKICEPPQRDITISDIRQIQLPGIGLTFRLLETEYTGSILQGPSGRMLDLGNDVLTCRVCASEIRGEALLCDTCGRAIHPKRFLVDRSHGFRCHECKRTTCRFDGHWTFRWLVFKKLLCPVCARDAMNKGRKLYEFNPISYKR